MPTLTFDTLVRSWNLLRKTREDDLKRLVPSLTTLDHVYAKKVAEDDETMTVQFSGFDSAVHDTSWTPQINRLILNWLRKFSDEVRIVRSEPNAFIVRISKGLKIGESVNINPAPKAPHKYKQPIREVKTQIIGVMRIDQIED